MAEGRDEPGIPVPESEDVVGVQLEDNGPNDVVESGAEAAARDDTDAGPAGFEKQFAARSAGLPT